MENIEISKLTLHPRNEEFFDDIEGGKWEDFKQSIIRRGVTNPIIISQDYIIVSGHQRIKACKELDITSIPCIINTYPDIDPQTHTTKEDQMLEDLICTNIMQRGVGNINALKLAKCAVELERIYGVRKGSAGKVSLESNNLTPKRTQEDIAKELNITKQQLHNYKKLLSLIPDLQDMVEDDDLKTTTATLIVKKLNPEEQEKMFAEIGKETLSRMTKKEVEKVTEQYTKQYDENNEKMQAEIELLQRQVAEKNKLELLIEKTLEEKRKLELDIVNLRDEKNQVKYIEKNVMIDKPETLAKIARLEKDIKDKEEYVSKYRESLNELSEKNEIISNFMGENTNFQLISKTSEITLKMMNFTKEMSQYDYLSDVFNEIPDATRREYVRSIYGVLKWAKNILDVVKHDDVIEVKR